MTTNLYYTPTGNPTTAARGISSVVREEFADVQTAFTSVQAIVSAILIGSAFYATDTGAANAYVATVEADYLTSLTEGLAIYMKAAHANTAASTLNLNTLGATQIVRKDGTALQAGDISTTGLVRLVYSTALTKWYVDNPLLLDSVALSGTPTAPTAAAGTSSTQIATTAFVAATAFSSALPAQATHADNVPTTDGTTASWTTRLKATVMGWKDGADATKQMLFSLAGITAGNTRTLTVPDKSGTLAMTSDLPVTFTSADQTITSAGALTIAHGLGAIPKVVQAFLRCTSTDANYSVGDVICAPIGPTDASVSNSGLSVTVDATNLTVRYGSGTNCFLYPSKTTGANSSLTNAKWSLFLRAQA